MSPSLRSKIIRLAHEHPPLRSHLLPILKTARVQFDTDRYEFQNYVKVTPSLYGTWEFQMGDPQVGEVFVVRASPYGNAQQKAEAEARQRGVNRVIVLP